MVNIISIEGNVGCGKTTILRHLQDQCKLDGDVLFLDEPVTLWENLKSPDDNESIMSKYCSDPAKYGFAFQVLVYVTRHAALSRMIEENPTCKVIICERSLDADEFVFAKMLYDQGQLEYLQFQIYQLVCRGYEIIPLSAVIYISTSSNICYERINQRGRVGEEKLSLKYVESCGNYHETWIADITERHPNTLVFRITADETTSFQNHDIGTHWITDIEAFILRFC